MSSINDSSTGNNADNPNKINKTLLISLILDFMANPLDQRSVEKFCEENNISKSTFYVTKRENLAYLNSHINDRRKVFMAQVKSYAYRALVARLNQSDAAQKLFFQLSGDLVERIEQTHNMLTPEQKREKAQELMKRLSGQLDDGSTDGVGP